MSAESKATYLRQYWADVRAGRREPPKRHANGVIRRVTMAQLGYDFGPDRGKRIVMTLHPDGRLELRPEHTRRAETILLTDVYRYALKCRVNGEVLAKARERKAKSVSAEPRNDLFGGRRMTSEEAHMRLMATSLDMIERAMKPTQKGTNMKANWTTDSELELAQTEADRLGLRHIVPGLNADGEETFFSDSFEWVPSAKVNGGQWRLFR